MSEAPVQKVEIFGQEYVLRTGESPEYVQKLSCYVDGKMKEIARHGVVSSGRLAVLAALEIADELFRAREGRVSLAAGPGGADDLLKLVREIDAVLADGVDQEGATARPSTGD